MDIRVEGDTVGEKDERMNGRIAERSDGWTGVDVWTDGQFLIGLQAMALLYPLSPRCPAPVIISVRDTTQVACSVHA